MLEIDKISVFYGDLQVLRDISIRVEKGEIVAIVGSNGAGKTTLLKTISGLLRPKDGLISFFGKRIDRLPAHKIVREGIVHVPEGRGIFRRYSVIDNLRMGAFTVDWRESSLDEIFQLFPRLKERRNQVAGTLSGGEQQMLAIARALMSNPKLLMLDEPSTGLAPKLVYSLFEELKKINERGISILLVEQNVHYALSLAHRGYVLETGDVILEGKTEDLRNNEQIKKAYLGI